MTLPTGTLSFAQINIELGFGVGADLSLNQASVRALAGKMTGPITLNDLRGKTTHTLENKTLTVESASDGTYTGFVDGTIGALSPSSFRGSVIHSICATNAPQDEMLCVVMAGDRAKSWFAYMQDHGRAIYYSSLSTHSYDVATNTTMWAWPINNPLWIVGATRAIKFVR